jgi:3-oxoacyl-[acyl-carrier protein] reductase
VWDRVFAVNVKGIFLAVEYAVPEMKRQGVGVIINTGSVTAHKPPRNVAAYASSKGAVTTLTKALAQELAPANIRVNCINPTAADTPLLRNIFGAEMVRSMAREMPLGRLTEPEDVAQAALFLASDESSMVTGSSVNPDGGRML